MISSLINNWHEIGLNSGSWKATNIIDWQALGKWHEISDWKVVGLDIGIILLLVGGGWLLILVFRTNKLKEISRDRRSFSIEQALGAFASQNWEIAGRPYLIFSTGLTLVVIFANFLPAISSMPTMSQFSIPAVERECQAVEGKLIKGRDCVQLPLTKQACQTMLQGEIDKAGYCRAAIGEKDCSLIGGLINKKDFCVLELAQNPEQKIAPSVEQTQLAENSTQSTRKNIPTETQELAETPQYLALQAESEKRELAAMLRARGDSSEGEKEAAFKKAFKPRAKCEDTNIKWEETVKCSNEKMNAREKFYKAHYGK